MSHAPDACPTFVCDACELPAFAMTDERLRAFVAHVLAPASYSDPTSLLWLCHSYSRRAARR